MRDQRELTKKQQTVYKYLSEYIRQYGYPPSVRDICKGVNLSSPSTAHFHLKALEEKGYIRRDASRNRSITLAESGGRGVPILGVVTAGQPILAVEDVEGYIPYDTESGDPHFALRVRGDSMIDAGILEDDYVIVRKQPRAENGEIVVALIEDEATVKRLVLKGRKVWLMPENENYEPINGSSCQILGRVCTVIRNY